MAGKKTKRAREEKITRASERERERRRGIRWYNTEENNGRSDAPAKLVAFALSHHTTRMNNRI